MSLSPEIKRLPKVLETFHKSGLMYELLRDSLVTKKGYTRNLVEDASRLSVFASVEVEGLENIPKERGGFVVINHPQIDILLPSLFYFTSDVKEVRERDLVWAMGIDLPMFGKYPVPFTRTILTNFASLYPDNIIPVPTSKVREHYGTGRASARERIVEELNKGKLVALSPEARVEKDNAILPTEVYRHGSGGIAKFASCRGIPQIPVGVWGEEDRVKVKIGEAFLVKTNQTDHEAAIELMAHVALCLPEDYRGPFRNKEG